MEHEILIQETKVERTKYDVAVILWDDGYHQCIGYNPIPNSKIRKEINFKISKWVGHKIKSKPL